MKNASNPVISRGDYVPLDWSVNQVELHFALDPQATVVTSRLHCQRRSGAAEAAPLHLDGDELTLLSVKVDGEPYGPERYALTEQGLALVPPAGEVCIEIVTQIDPSRNTTLSGLYLSDSGLFTQCEAQGFRRITFFPDRPDVMARYRVTLEADKARFPVLLSNGNLLSQTDLPDGRHRAEWEDPFPKPSYLFALVAADLVALERKVNTQSGREVLLQVWVAEHDLDRSEHAMASLIKALRWDEEKFGLELDLDRYMIVAVSDFNMGAMENKGLNIFNAKYVLAKPDTATDVDYDGIESVVAHEYFHNWTGNRVTCRDWFQLTLKEGLTVFRDQQFSADMLAEAAGDPVAAASARAVKRIDDVRVLRSAQFPEDNGPMAHPIRPEQYQEINNFYTATVYEKGAEVIRMLHTLLGAEGFRNGMDLYFSYHDGSAVTCDDFVDCMAEANGCDLDQFMLWYQQAGTPRVSARMEFDAQNQHVWLHFKQRLPAASAHLDRPLLIPIALGLIDANGEDIPLRLQGEAQVGGTTRVLRLSEFEQSFCFTGIAAEPVPSLLRGFSAPVILELEESDAALAFRMANDSDAFNRWDAAQKYMERVVFALVEDAQATVPQAFVEAFARLITDEQLDPAFRAQATQLPSESYLLDRMRPARPQALRAALVRMMRSIGTQLADELLALYEQHGVSGEYRFHPADAGRRALRNLALRYLCSAGMAAGWQRAQQQYAAAGNMTDRMGALTALVQSACPAREQALTAFRECYANDSLVLDKWFALQAGAWRWGDDAAPVLARVESLLADPAFALTNPNKVYALFGTFFRANSAEFHRADGAGYVFWADQVIALDQHNPQVAARMARLLENWKTLEPALQDLVRPQLQRVRQYAGISTDVGEIVGKALGE